MGESKPIHKITNLPCESSTLGSRLSDVRGFLTDSRSREYLIASL